MNGAWQLKTCIRSQVYRPRSCDWLTDWMGRHTTRDIDINCRENGSSARFRFPYFFNVSCNTLVARFGAVFVVISFHCFSAIYSFDNRINIESAVRTNPPIRHNATDRWSVAANRMSCVGLLLVPSPTLSPSTQGKLVPMEADWLLVVVVVVSYYYYRTTVH